MKKITFHYAAAQIIDLCVYKARGIKLKILKGPFGYGCLYIFWSYISTNVLYLSHLLQLCDIINRSF